MDGRAGRATRILDAAAALLVAWGYRRVTIEEVAKRAGVGKGTVYLHWRSRDELFLAALLRESGEMLEGIVLAARNDPATILPHRYFRLLFLELFERPLLRAMFTMDTETLGNLVDHRTGRQVSQSKTLVSEEYFELLAEHGLIGSPLRPKELMYAIASTFLGFLVADPLMPENFGLSEENKVDAFTETVRGLLDPDTPPDEATIAELAPKITEKIADLAELYRRYSDPPQAP